MKKLTVGILNCNRGIEISLLIYSLINQTYQDFDIIIIDDNSNNFLYENSTFKSLLKLHENLGHKIEIIKGKQKGPHYAGQLLLENSKSDFILRLDDDVTLQSDCIEKLINCFTTDDIVAVGPIYLLPFVNISEQIIDLDQILDYEKIGKITLIDQNHIDVNGSLQMNILKNFRGNIEVEHLHSGFMYRRLSLENIGGYFLGYSKVAHREESDTSYRLFLNKGKLLVCPEAICFHYHPLFGGIRTDNNGIQNKTELWEQDEKIFIERFKNNFSSGISGYVPPEENKEIEVELEKADIVSNNGRIYPKEILLNSVKPKIHLVTVTHGTHEKLANLIHTVLKYRNDLYSWIIINNDPSEGSRCKFTNLMENVRNCFNKYLLTEDDFYRIMSYKNLDKELSVSQARNIGASIRPSETEYICFIDDDAEILGKWSDDDWLDIMYKEIIKEKDIGAVSPICTWFDPLKSHVLSVACLLVPVKVWRQVGGFDPVFGNKEKGTWGYEDTDWSYRLQSMGYKIKGISAENFPFYHEDTTRKKKTEWQEKGLLKAKELLLSKHNIKEETDDLIRTVYPFTKEQLEVKGNKINIGCYHMKLDGFTNIDLNPDCCPDVCGDIRNMKFPDNSVDLILASQVIEHFDSVDVKELFLRFYKCLKSDGHLIIEVPDVGKILDMVEGGDDIDKYQNAIYGEDTVMGMKHKIQFDSNLLTGMLQEAGFNNIVKNNKTSDNDEITLRYDVKK